MNKLDYSISLREKGLASADIKKKMIEKGFEEAEILYYLKKSDEIFLNQLVQPKRSRPGQKNNYGLKMITLVISLTLLTWVFFGYGNIGLLGLFILWSIIKYGAYRDY